MNTAESRKKKSLSHIGLKELAETKIKKSNTIIAINEEDNSIMICDSGKLFGDFVGTTKDMIKNCLRHPSKYKTYRLYYADAKKRKAIQEKVLGKKYIRDHGYLDYSELLDELDLNTYKKYFKTIYILQYIDGKKFKRTMYIG